MNPRPIQTKIKTRDELQVLRRELREAGKKVVFTNGCFDLLQVGHADYLACARAQGDVLGVGINSDASTRSIKGDDRPIVQEDERAGLVASLEVVDYVTVFDEKEPAALIADLLPDVLVKGEDWSHYVSGREAVESNGGKVVLARMTEGRSSTGLIEKIRGEG